MLVMEILTHLFLVQNLDQIDQRRTSRAGVGQCSFWWISQFHITYSGFILVRYELVLWSFAINGRICPNQLRDRFLARYLRVTMYWDIYHQVFLGNHLPLYGCRMMWTLVGHSSKPWGWNFTNSEKHVRLGYPFGDDIPYLTWLYGSNHQGTSKSMMKFCFSSWCKNSI